MLTRIHVNQHVIKANRKHGQVEPPLSVKRGKLNAKAHVVEVEGAVPDHIYSPNKPLACGATVWIETHAKVTAGVWPRQQK